MAINMRYWQIRITVLFSSVYFFYYLARINYPLALPFLKTEFGVSNLELGTIATALTLCYAVGQLTNGFIVDRIGPGIMMLIGGLGSCAANLLMGWNSVFTLFPMFWGLNGYFQSMGYPATLKLVSNWFPRQDQRGKPVGMSEMLQSVASLIIIPFSAVVGVALGWRYIFYVPSIMLLIASVLFFAFSRDAPNPVKAVKKPLLQDIKESYGTAFSNWRLISANFSYGFSTFVRYSLITWIPLYLYQASGQDLFKAVWIATTFQIGGVIGSPLVGWLSDNYFASKKWLLIALGMLVSGVAGTSIGFIPITNPLLIMAVLLLCGVAIESLEVAYFLTPVEILGDKLSATGVGTMNATGKFVASFQGIVLGYLIDSFGWYSAFICAGLFGIVSAALILPLKGNRRKTS